MKALLARERKPRSLISVAIVRSPWLALRPHYHLADRAAEPAASGQPLPVRTFNMVLPRLAGESATVIPAERIAAILSAAVPLPPEMMAPAWPIRRPGGAVTPAIKRTTGFFFFTDLDRKST